MVTAWYTLIIGILITLDGIVLLIFDIDGFMLPDWYVGLMLLAGVVGIILGMVYVNKKKPALEDLPDENKPDEDSAE